MSRTIDEIDLSKIVFSKTKVNTKNKFLYVYSDKKPLVLKFPKSRLPFGLNKDTLSNKKQYIMDLSFEDNPELLKNFEDLDNAIVQKVKDEFFQDKTLDEVKNMYVSCIKYPTNPQYNPTFRSKIVTKDDETIKCDFYNSEKDSEGKYPKIDLESEGGESYMLIAMQKNAFVESILECIGVWFHGDKFGLSFKTIQVKIYPKTSVQNNITDCEFLDSDSDTSNSDADFIG